MSLAVRSTCRKTGVGVLIVALGLSISASRGQAQVGQAQAGLPRVDKPPAGQPQADKLREGGDPNPLPGGRPQDTARAIQEPDEFAWQLFLSLSRQALAGKRGELDPAKPTIKDYDPDKSVVWETWALSSGGRSGSFRVVPNQSEVFRDRGEKPAAWDELPTSSATRKSFEPLPAQQRVGLSPEAIEQVKLLLRISPTAAAEDGSEVRMNRATYDHVRDNNLFSLEGLEDTFRANRKIDFPVASQEIKAQWQRIEEKDKPRYHWRTVNGKLWGLTGLHIITRDLPNWFWCDFEHVDYEPMAEFPSVDRTTRGDQVPREKQGIRPETVGSKWANYRLRGSQVDFTDAQGRPTVLANTQIERGFQQTSSCITCHARATVGLRTTTPLPDGRVADPNLPNSLPTFVQVLSQPGTLARVRVGAVGTPDTRWFQDDRGATRYIQTDFIWALPFRVLSTKESPPAPGG